MEANCTCLPKKRCLSPQGVLPNSSWVWKLRNLSQGRKMLFSDAANTIRRTPLRPTVIILVQSVMFVHCMCARVWISATNKYLFASHSLHSADQILEFHRKCCSYILMVAATWDIQKVKKITRDYGKKEYYYYNCKWWRTLVTDKLKQNEKDSYPKKVREGSGVFNLKDYEQLNHVFTPFLSQTCTDGYLTQDTMSTYIRGGKR